MATSSNSSLPAAAVKQKKTVTDIIMADKRIKNDLSNLLGKRTIVSAGTGTGKTYFVLHYFIPWCVERGLKVCYLCNRCALHKQINNQIKEIDDHDQVEALREKYHISSRVKIYTYQYIEQLILLNDYDFLWSENKIDTFDVIIVDESHYFFDDGAFNKFTDISFDYVMRGKTVLFLSATNRNMTRYFRENQIMNEFFFIPPDYSHVKKKYWFYGHKIISVLDDIVYNKLGDGDKVICFVNSIKTMQEIQEYFAFTEGVVFVCSEGMRKKNQWAKEHCYIPSEVLIESEDGGYTFNGKLMVVTSVIDSGVDLKDRAIKFLVTDIKYVNTIIQCLGRKRPVDDTDTCEFYIRAWNKNEIRYWYRKHRRDIETNISHDVVTGIRLGICDIKEFERLRDIDLIIHKKDEHGNDYTCINETVYHGKLYTQEYYTQIKSGKRSFKTFVNDYLKDIPEQDIVPQDLVPHEKVEAIIDYLSMLEGQYIFTDEEKEEIAKVSDIKRGDKDPKKIPKILNEYYDKCHIPYYVDNSERHRIRGKQVRVWIIRKRDTAA